MGSLPPDFTPRKWTVALVGLAFFVPGSIIIPILARKGAPFLPTTKANLKDMFDGIQTVLEAEAKVRNVEVQELVARKRLVDLGSGDGRVVFEAVRRGFVQAEGCEINPVLWLFTQFSKPFRRSGFKAKFYLKDYHHQDLSHADVITVYGVTDVPLMTRMMRKLDNELKPNALLVSNRFEIPDTPSFQLLFNRGSVFFYAKKSQENKKT